ncbi:DUF3572 family protein [Novosphingopyxis baekryungensis]|uniref:DUF3572 family protein n=1 Tax=Novosphingopyxis baekryungensis TaxID=279369 RepID=UPI0003B3F3E5|nr:DUF3572 family protein [Novosphingopyxis baekryungensis]
MRSPTSNPISHTDPVALALDALAWIMSDDARAVRFLDLTGLTPDALRAGLQDQATHRAVLGFLEAYEPDLVSYAEARQIDPSQIPAAARKLDA